MSPQSTSQDCSNCGSHVDQNLGGLKYFKGLHYGHSMPRDGNGALGTWWKALGGTICLNSSPVKLLRKLLPEMARVDISEKVKKQLKNKINSCPYYSILINWNVNGAINIKKIGY